MFTGKDSPLDKPVYLAEEIVLPYSENVFTLDFAAMDFSRALENQFRYKLDGFDEEWIESGNNHSATFTNLDPGTYTFMVIGSNGAGLWNETPTTIRIVILAPWYRTWWFATLLLMVIGWVLYKLYHNRLQHDLKLRIVRNETIV